MQEQEERENDVAKELIRTIIMPIKEHYIVEREEEFEDNGESRRHSL